MFKHFGPILIASIFLSIWVTAADINDRFREEEIIPDIIDDIALELQPINVTYPSSGVSVNLGNELRPSQVRIQPEVTWEAEIGAFYTLLMSGKLIVKRNNR
ncbi:hypothetical protein HA402_013711 [Bradysia odoriphaga]|nr:hypothetical protein HA402_013711 [Bradysia odoriphaga]